MSGRIDLAETPLLILVPITKVDLRVKTIDSLTLLCDGIKFEIIISLS